MPDQRASKTGEVTQLLRRGSEGDSDAWDRAFSLLYDELRRIAGSQMRRENDGHTLQPTALVNEAYVKLVKGPPQNPADRQHFVALAARAMRQVLVDHARAHKAAKRGGGVRPVTLDEAAARSLTAPEDIIALDTALERLDGVDPQLRQVVELRYFGGMHEPEIATLLGVTPRTVRRYWSRARAWLHRELNPEDLQAEG